MDGCEVAALTPDVATDCEAAAARFLIWQVLLFNDILLVLSSDAEGKAREALDVISLAKVQVKLLPEPVDGIAPYAFELWSLAKI